MSRRIFLGLSLLLGILIGAPARASELEIQFLGLDLNYDGTDLHDATSILGGDTHLADPLTAVDFIVDGTSVGTLTSGIWADVYIKDVPNLPVSGGAVMSGGNGDDFGFDLLMDVGGFLGGLALNINQVQIFYTGGKISISGGALATSIFAQDLPFGLEVDPNQPVTIAFSSASLKNVIDNGAGLTSFSASGTGNVRAEMVPEPSSLVLTLAGLVGLVGSVRRRWHCI